MATPEANLSGVRGSGDAPPRHLHNFNTFQFVSQLVSATPPYLFNMSTPFPGNFFSDLLRRMAPRAGTPGLPPDQTLQQQIRAALLAKSAPPPPPSLPPTVMPPPLDLAAATHRSPAAPQLHPEKGVKRSLFSDVSALSSSEDEGGAKRPRLDTDGRESEQHPPEALPAPFLMQAPFLHSSVPPPHDVLNPWSSRASLLRPQVPLAAHVPPTPLDPYRLLLDLRLAGQLRTMAATQALQHKETTIGGGGGGGLGLHPPITSSHSSIPTSKSVTSRNSPTLLDSRPPREELPPVSAPPSMGVLQGGDDRVSAFHPPSRPHPDTADTSDEENGDRRSCSRSSSGSASSAREGLGPQYIFKHLTQIYRTIDGHKVEGGESGDDIRHDHSRKEHHRPATPESAHTAPPRAEGGRGGGEGQQAIQQEPRAEMAAREEVRPKEG
ncbi:ras-associated and pleckstrin homology domains-containing protein 1-like [Macrobrachium rosenbergii]|uniref:ras-associated and pleckstrin homology domains-containing protein 1-like n=1 Tax=Macrobrachium rosenbergii TaxID=79674 RepID=UPI0034D5DA06